MIQIPDQDTHIKRPLDRIHLPRRAGYLEPVRHDGRVWEYGSEETKGFGAFGGSFDGATDCVEEGDAGGGPDGVTTLDAGAIVLVIGGGVCGCALGDLVVEDVLCDILDGAVEGTGRRRWFCHDSCLYW